MLLKQILLSLGERFDVSTPRCTPISSVASKLFILKGAHYVNRPLMLAGSLYPVGLADAYRPTPMALLVGVLSKENRPIQHSRDGAMSRARSRGIASSARQPVYFRWLRPARGWLERVCNYVAAFCVL